MRYLPLLWRAGAIAAWLACTPNVTHFVVTTASAVSIAPSFVVVAPGDHVTFTATGGSGALHYAFVGGAAASGSDATLDASGKYTAGSIGSVTDTIIVSDGRSDQATATITVTAALTIDTLTTAVAPAQRLVIAAGGGKPPYQFTLAQNASGGSITAQSGVYTAGMTAGTTDQVEVTDANQRTQTIAITVGAALSLTLAVPPATPFAINKLIATGGATPYAFAFQAQGNRSNAALDAVTGAYTPGNNPLATDRLQVTDATGSVATTTVPIGEQTALVGHSTGPCLQADFDGDGSLELLLDAYQNNLAHIVHFDPLDGPSVRNIAIPSGSHPRHMMVTDFNGDGRSDLVVGTDDGQGDGATTVYLGDVSGSLTSSNILTSAPDTLGLAAVANALYFADGNLCGGTDGVGSDTSSSPETCPSFSASNVPSLLLGEQDDVNGSELVYYSATAPHLAVLGHSTTLSATDVIGGVGTDLGQFLLFSGSDPSAFLPFEHVQALATGAPIFTPTLIGTTAFEGMIAVPLAPGHDLALFWNGNNGNIAAYDYSATAKTFSPFASPPRVADFQVDCVTDFDANGDGVPDLLLSGDSTDHVHLWLGEGDGTFAHRPRFTMGQPLAPVVGTTNHFISITPQGILASYFATADHEIALADTAPLAQSVYAEFGGAFGASGESAVLVQLNSNAMQVVPFRADGTFAAPFDVSGTLSTLYGAPQLANFGGAASGPDLLAFDNSQPSDVATVYRIIRDSPTALHVEGLPAITGSNNTNAALGAADLDGDGLDDAIVVAPTTPGAVMVEVALSSTGGLTWSDRSPAGGFSFSCAGTARVTAALAGVTSGGVAFYLNALCNGVPADESQLVVVPKSGAAQLSALPYFAFNVVSADVDHDAVPDLVLRDVAGGAIHTLLGPSFAQELTPVFAPGDVFDAVPQPAGLADLVLFSYGAQQAEVLTAAGGTVYQ
jgi:hypothetical protein